MYSYNNASINILIPILLDFLEHTHTHRPFTVLEYTGLYTEAESQHSGTQALETISA